MPRSDERRPAYRLNVHWTHNWLPLPVTPQWPIAVRPEPDRPQPRLDVNAGGGRAAGMAVSVGRVRVEGDRVRIVALVHNLVRGAAGGAVLNGELAHAYHYL